MQYACYILHKFPNILISPAFDALFVQVSKSYGMVWLSVVSHILKWGHVSKSIVFHEKFNIYQVHIMCFYEARCLDSRVSTYVQVNNTHIIWSVRV
jgi:hypothetical protein